MRIEKYSVEKIKPHKMYAIWVWSGKGIYPLCYLKKPSWMSTEQYERVAKSIRLNAPKDLLEVPE